MKNTLRLIRTMLVALLTFWLLIFAFAAFGIVTFKLLEKVWY